jgi:t-SNARE complex subunit (syntaxin)
MKDQFLELSILSSEIWNEAKAIRYNVANKKKAISKIEKLIEKVKKLNLDAEIEIIKQVNNITK